MYMILSSMNEAEIDICAREKTTKYVNWITRLCNPIFALTVKYKAWTLMWLNTEHIQNKSFDWGISLFHNRLSPSARISENGNQKSVLLETYTHFHDIDKTYPPIL